MKIVKSTSTMTRCLLLGLVSWLAFVASASAQGIECVPAGWHTDVSHTPGPGPDSGVLSFGPPINAGFNRILSQVVVGDQIQLVITPYSICGIGIRPPAERMSVPISAPAPGQYRVSLKIRQGAASVISSNLPVTIFGSGANVIPTLSPSQLLALVGVLLAVGLGLVSVRRRVNTRGQQRS